MGHLDFVQSVLDDAVKNNAVAGASCLIFHKEKEVGYYESGFADIAWNRKFSRDTICRMYSMSKPVTSAAVWSLIQEGKLDLLDSVASYIPSFSNLTVCHNGSAVPCETPVTIQDLLNMTSGLSYGGNSDESHIKIAELISDINSSLNSSAPLTTMQIAERVGHIPLGFVPGTDFEYGISADILGAVVEKVSGMKFGEFLRKRFFEPMGMNDTGFYVPSNKASRLSEEYYAAENGNLEVYAYPNLGIPYKSTEPPSFESGGAGLLSTADDYMKFCRMLLSDGRFNGLSVLEPKTVQSMHSMRISDAIHPLFLKKHPHLCGYSYGNLMRIMTDSSQSVAMGTNGEYGWDGWLGTFMLIDPANELALVYMMQKADSGFTPTARKIKNVVYSALT
ncbi:MAG: beta-lactamase family protein [Treponema sp.]|nr:beta-lactamase family protein [Treponema sp.]